MRKKHKKEKGRMSEDKKEYGRERKGATKKEYGRIRKNKKG